MPRTTLTAATAALITASFGLAGTAFAQDDMMQDTPVLEPAPMTETTVTTFASADIDQDGLLNADEFQGYLVGKAGEGDEDARAVVISGDYQTAFAEHDADMDGQISEAELVKTEPEAETESDPLEF